MFNINTDDIEAIIILVAWFVAVFALGLMTTIIGNIYWTIFARVGAASMAVEWIAHAAALASSGFVMWSILCRFCGEKCWPWN